MHCVFIAGIEDQTILGMDLVSINGFQRDLMQGLVKLGNEELVLYYGESSPVRAILTIRIEAFVKCSLLEIFNEKKRLS